MILAAVAAGVWLYLLVGRGRFWRMRAAAAEGQLRLPAPPVAAVIPARNEAAVVGRSMASLARQRYAGEFHIVLVDDDSSDGTAVLAREAGQITVVRAGALPRGWTGKLWAVSEGVRHAARFDPEYLLLTDADIVHPPENVAALVARAQSGGYDLVSYMATLQCRTVAERALVPAFVFFFFLLYPPVWISDKQRATAGAAGGCMLIRREALERIGGVESIAGELIDDCALAGQVKRHGGRVWLGLSPATASIREYATFGEIGSMISRTAFTQLRHSPLLLAGTVAGMAVVYIGPFVGIASGGWARRIGICGWAMMSAAYLPALRYYGRSPLWAPLLPAVALFYIGATLHSAVSYWRGVGGKWKGRVQDG
jgi:hopene-associated glycosyltransferase HpnB